jgi:hypothetical protein
VPSEGGQELGVLYGCRVTFPVAGPPWCVRLAQVYVARDRYVVSEGYYMFMHGLDLL